MDIRAFQTKLFEKGREFGFSDMEIYYQADRATNVKVFKGEIDAYTISEKGGLSFRGLIDGKMGYSYTEKLDEESISFLLEEARNNAAIIESEEQEELFGGSERYTELDSYSETLAATSPDRLIDAALELERVALAYDPRIEMANYLQVVNSESELTIANTKGLDRHARNTLAFGYISTVAKEAGDVQSGSDHAYVLDDFSKLNVAEIATTAAQEAVSRLSADTIESNNYTVILRNGAAASLMSAYTSIFSGEAVEKGLSRLQGKLGEQVAGANISIIDDPFLAGAPGCAAFDAEGTATARHELVKEGQLQTFLHNRKSAAKAGTESTGNAFKATYRSTVSIEPNNLFVQPGEMSLDELIAGTERGLLVDDLQGLHAGTNAVSGDFSLFCHAYLIENGTLVRPVNQITVSGNFFEMLNQVEAVGNDLRFTGFSRGACGSPSLKVKSLAISGK